MLRLTVLDRNGRLQVELFVYSKSRLPEMSDLARAQRLVAQGEAAIANGNLIELRNVNRQLRALLPDDPGDDPFSTVVEDDR